MQPKQAGAQPKAQQVYDALRGAQPWARERQPITGPVWTTQASPIFGGLLSVSSSNTPATYSNAAAVTSTVGSQG